MIKSILRKANLDKHLSILLTPYRRRQQRILLANVDRSDSHTYTSFYRSPFQLQALTGPVLDFLSLGKGEPVKIAIFACSNGSEPYTIASHLIRERPELNFEIVASDLHQSMIDKAVSGEYAYEEISQGLPIPEEFLLSTFDKKDATYHVKDAIKNKITFRQADLLSEDIKEFAKADIVVIQNVLFHMDQNMAEKAFDSVVQLLKPKSVLFIDGMELDMRVDLTKKEKLRPLDFFTKEIHNYSRKHVPGKWWMRYYGSEPYSFFVPDRLRRYCTIFFKG